MNNPITKLLKEYCEICEYKKLVDGVRAIVNDSSKDMAERVCDIKALLGSKDAPPPNAPLMSGEHHSPITGVAGIGFSPNRGGDGKGGDDEPFGKSPMELQFDALAYAARNNVPEKDDEPELGDDNDG